MRRRRVAKTHNGTEKPLLQNFASLCVFVPLRQTECSVSAIDTPPQAMMPEFRLIRDSVTIVFSPIEIAD